MRSLLPSAKAFGRLGGLPRAAFQFFRASELPISGFVIVEGQTVRSHSSERQT